MATYTQQEIDTLNKQPNKLILVINGGVYDVFRFRDEHPGEAGALDENKGLDATKAFEEVGHSKDAREQLKKYHIGTLVEKKVEVTEKEKQQDKAVGDKSSTYAGAVSHWIPLATAATAIAIIGFLVYSRQKKSSSTI